VEAARARGVRDPVELVKVAGGSRHSSSSSSNSSSSSSSTAAVQAAAVLMAEAKAAAASEAKAAAAPAPRPPPVPYRLRAPPGVEFIRGPGSVGSLLRDLNERIPLGRSVDSLLRECDAADQDRCGFVDDDGRSGQEVVVMMNQDKLWL